MAWRLVLVSAVMSVIGVVCAPLLLAVSDSMTIQPVTVQEKPQPLPIKPIISGKPVQIIVPSTGINLPVVDGVYNPNDQSWSLGDHTAQFAATTPLANDTAGNTFIYGHNSRAVFHKLIPIKPGAEVQVITDNGKVFHYTFRKSFDVDPHQVEAIKHTGAPMLTIQTCVGQYYEKRRMFQFDFINVTDKVPTQS